MHLLENVYENIEKFNSSLQSMYNLSANFVQYSMFQSYFSYSVSLVSFFLLFYTLSSYNLDCICMWRNAGKRRYKCIFEQERKKERNRKWNEEEEDDDEKTGFEVKMQTIGKVSVDA